MKKFELNRTAEEISKADFLNTVTKLFFKEFTKFAKDAYAEPMTITFSDKEIDKDYGIYSTFKVKELPDYLFGLWWYEDTIVETRYDYDENFKITNERKEEVKYLRGAFFGDYEREIDKFKPWRCNFNVYILCEVDELKKLINKEIGYFPTAEKDGYGSFYGILGKFNFIKNEPELAFCQCWNGWDYNEEYHSRESARNEYRKYLEYKRTKQEQDNIALKLQFEYFNNLLKSKGAVQYKDFIVNDENYGGWCVSPRFETFIKCPTTWRDEFKEHLSDWGGYGCYSIFDLLSETKEESEKMYKEYRKFCDDLQKKYKYVWFVDKFSDCAVLVTPERFSKMKKRKSIIDIDAPEKYFETEVFE